MARISKQARRERDAELRSRLKILKAKGEYSGDLRKPLTRYAREKAQSEKFAPIWRGEVKPFKAPSKKAAERYSSRYEVKGRKIYVPAGEPYRWSTKHDRLSLHGKEVRPFKGKPRRPGEPVIYRVRIKTRTGDFDLLGFDTLRGAEKWMAHYPAGVTDKGTEFEIVVD